MTPARVSRALCSFLVLLGACSGSDGGASRDAGPTTADTAFDAANDSMMHSDITTETDTCAPSCAGRECGDDGCGGSCGGCTEGETCEEGMCNSGGGCEPNCGHWNLCGEDGCGGSCGFCDEGVECLNTHWGSRCTVQCDLFTCPDGQNCLFGHCFDEECKTDADCGDASAYRCDAYHRCLPRIPCLSTDDCNTKGPNYCNQDVGYCFYGGHCWDDSDCTGGTCGPDHWCQDHNCHEMYGPDCPPHMPICEMPSGEEPLCDGMPCASCVAPCIFDMECPEGQRCDWSHCEALGTGCDLDSECPDGEYCEYTCRPLLPACTSEADCQGRTLCLAGFCVGWEANPCEQDAECDARYEGDTCQEGICKPPVGCLLDSQCEASQHCRSETCLPYEPPECKVDADCQPGHICQSEECRLPPECIYDVQCPDGHACEDQHCYNDAGVCAWLEKGPGFCDDGDPCTVDTCDAITGCIHQPGTCQ